MVQLATSTIGNGPALTVLLHGTGRNLRKLALQGAARDRGCKFLLPDLLGHGDSPPFTLAAVVNTLVKGGIALFAGGAPWLLSLLGSGHFT